MCDYHSNDKLVKKTILNPGKYSKKPTNLSICTLYLEDCHCLELTVEQIKIKLNSDIIIAENTNVIVTIGNACSTVDRLLERAIQTMFLDEQSLITIDVTIEEKKSTTLSLKITLKDAKFFKQIWEWSFEEKYDVALKYKEQGVKLFKAKRYVDAFYKFSQSCKILITLEPIEKDIELKFILYNNMAECQLMKKNYEHVIALCDKVIASDKNNVKAFYRRGVAYAGLNNFEKATNDLKIVITLEPRNKFALEKYNVYRDKWSKSVLEYDNIVRKMFNS